MSKSELIKIGKTTFNKTAFAGMNKTDFKKHCSDHKILVDVDKAWDQIKGKTEA